jgi:hypothetical protein
MHDLSMRDPSVGSQVDFFVAPEFFSSSFEKALKNIHRFGGEPFADELSSSVVVLKLYFS